MSEGRRWERSLLPILVMCLMLMLLLPPLPAVPSTPVYSTDFEHVTKKDAHELNMGIDNEFEFGGDGGASIWMEGLDRNTPGITCHSGSRCVGMELTDITKSRRNEFDILNLQNLGITNGYFVSVWLYLPANWQLHAPSPAWNWYELSDPAGTNGPTYYPENAVHITQPNISAQSFNLDFDTWPSDSYSNWVTLEHITNFAVPRGRWFNLQYYVHLDPTNGIIRVWIDGNLLFDHSNITTSNPNETPKTIIAKIYYDTNDTFSPYRIWVDDLGIYNREVSMVTSVSLDARLDASSSPRTVLISGSIYPASGGPVNVTLEFSNDQGTTYAEMAHVTSSPDGTFSYSWKLPSGGMFLIRADAQGAKSSPASIAVSTGVPGFPLESLLVGSALGLVFAIMRRRQRASKRVLPSF